MVPSFHAFANRIGNGDSTSCSEFTRSDEYTTSDDEVSCIHLETKCVDWADEIQHPRNEDVLLGRGSMHQRHPGNMRYTELIHHNQDSYFASDDVMTKKLIVYRIVDNILAEGRFLKRESSNSSAWIAIPKEEARRKVAHAIQYLQRRSRQGKQGCSPTKMLRRVSFDSQSQSAATKVLRRVSLGSQSGSARLDPHISRHSFHQPNHIEMDYRNMRLGDGSTLMSSKLVDLPLELEPIRLESSPGEHEGYLPCDDAWWHQDDDFSERGHGASHHVQCSSPHTSFHFCLKDLMLDSRPNVLLRSASIGSFDPHET